MYKLSYAKIERPQTGRLSKHERRFKQRAKLGEPARSLLAEFILLAHEPYRANHSRVASWLRRRIAREDG